MKKTMKKVFEIGKEYEINVKDFDFDKTGKRFLVNEYIFLGRVEQICDNHIIFHKINTVMPEGFKESFQIWDLERYQVSEINNQLTA